MEVFKIFVGDNNQPEALNKKALTIITRVRDKLTGRDFSHEETLSVQRQVDLLIQQATNNENLCQCYIGWYVMIIDNYIGEKGFQNFFIYLLQFLKFSSYSYLLILYI